MSPVATARRVWEGHAVIAHRLFARQLGPDPITVSCVRSSRPPARELPVMAGSAVAWAGAPRGGSF